MRSKHVRTYTDRIVEDFELDHDEHDALGSALDQILSRHGEDTIRIAGGVLDIGQPATMGGMWTGLDATPTGSDAANDVVADFTGSTAIIFDTPSIAIPVLATHSQTLGSTFKVQAEGVWLAFAKVHAITAASVRAGIGFDNVAGDLSIDPAYSSRTLDIGLSISAAADTVPIMVQSGPIVVTRGLALDPAAGIVRLLLSNNAGAGAAAASLSLTLASIKVLRLGNIPRAVN